MKETQFEYHLQVEQESDNWSNIDLNQNIGDLIWAEKQNLPEDQDKLIITHINSFDKSDHNYEVKDIYALGLDGNGKLTNIITDPAKLKGYVKVKFNLNENNVQAIIAIDLEITNNELGF